MPTRNFTRLDGTGGGTYFSADNSLKIGGYQEFEIELEVYLDNFGLQMFYFADYRNDPAPDDVSMLLRNPGGAAQALTSTTGSGFQNSGGNVAPVPPALSNGVLHKIRVIKGPTAANPTGALVTILDEGTVGLHPDEYDEIAVPLATTLFAGTTLPVLLGTSPVAASMVGYLANYKVWVGGDRDTGTLIYDYPLDDTWSGGAPYDAVGTGPATEAIGITSADSEPFTYNPLPAPFGQWENVGVTKTIPLAFAPDFANEGAGEFQATDAVVEGAGLVIVPNEGTGVFQASTATVAGAGLVIVPNEGSGAFQASTAVVSGAGLVQVGLIELGVNAFITVSGANDYFLTDLRNDQWLALGYTKQEQAIITAATQINFILKDECKLGTINPLSIPESLAYANAELALAMALDPSIITQTDTSIKTKSVKAGKTSVTFFSSASNNGTRFPITVMRFLGDSGCLLTSTTSGGFASGTDSESQFEDTTYNRNRGFY